MHQKIKPIAIITMTTATYTTMQNLAKQAAAYITKLNGEAETFEIESNGITAVIAYDAEIVEDKGDYWTAPSWSIEDETVAVEANVELTNKNNRTMNAFAFKVIDAINREGIGNEAWGLVEEVDDTVAYFGTREEIELKGQWAYVYADKNDFFGYIDKVEPTRVLHVEDCQLLLYKLD